MIEIWKDIAGYEGLYEVSNLGKVRSVDRVLVYKDRRAYHQKGVVFKNHLMKNGYCKVCLKTNGKAKWFLTHRLVAEAFIPNPNNLPEVNHKDENPSNNCVENLEWCDRLYNNNYKNHNSNNSKSQPNRKIILQYSLNGALIKEWASIGEINKNLGYAKAGISACCNGRIYKGKHSKSAYGYIWKFKEQA